ncbi:9287_t:CDS:10 [Ambispora gerdemannii]|uniref:9287_t:CDS:1 n=1 Tax=Ambispora gerdemannii TaxID=144530 RepID=A0A9N8YNP8_9GLOM|nr:9287_t:CDS:10 [Ambispora gerdemannii]
MDIVVSFVASAPFTPPPTPPRSTTLLNKNSSNGSRTPLLAPTLSSVLPAEEPDSTNVVNQFPLLDTDTATAATTTISLESPLTPDSNVAENYTQDDKDLLLKNSNESSVENKSVSTDHTEQGLLNEKETELDSGQQISNFGLWDYVKEEITALDFEPSEEMTTERVTNFLTIPIAMEKLMIFGVCLCLDSFLYTFTFLPLRFIIALYTLFIGIFRRLKNGITESLTLSQQCDLLKGLLVIFVCLALQRVDAAQMYHSIRGQAVIKLYVIFNVLEILDRLCCSFGSDILDSLSCKSTLAGLSLNMAHTMIMSYQVITLNVAINSYSNALLTLLLSNQFIEIKSSVFKRFEKENLFQLSCADIVERFQLALFLTIITVRNLIELSGSPPSTSSNLPTSFFPLFPKMTTIETLLTPVFIVMASEFLVDWLKHAFITKFNQIRPSVYDKFVDVLCCDVITEKYNRRNTVDRSPNVARRIGFAPLPLACLMITVAIQTITMITDWSLDMDDELSNAPIAVFSRSSWIACGSTFFCILVILKIFIGTKLLIFSNQREATRKNRPRDDEHHIEQKITEETIEKQQILNDPKDNFAGQSKPKITFDNIERYMIFKSRIP